jgi:hypothetical protein
VEQRNKRNGLEKSTLCLFFPTSDFRITAQCYTNRKYNSHTGNSSPGYRNDWQEKLHNYELYNSNFSSNTMTRIRRAWHLARMREMRYP